MRDGHVGFIAGAGPTLLRTIDGGASWEHRPLPTGGDLTAVSARNTQVVAVGPSFIVRSTDSGETFTAVALPPAPRPTLDFLAVSIVTTTTAFVVSSDGSVWRTGNGFGTLEHRSTITFGPVHAAHFDGPNRGWVVGGANGAGWVARTLDGGRTFTRVYDSPGGVLRDITGLNLGGHGLVITAGEGMPTGATAWEDGQGAAWTPFDLYGAAVSGVSLAYVPNVGELWFAADDGLLGIRTGDEEGYERALVQTRPRLTDVSAGQVSTAFAVGEGGTIIRAGWGPPATALPLAGNRKERFTAASFPADDGRFGVLVDNRPGDPQVWVTRNGGATFTMASRASHPIEDVTFVDESHGFGVLLNGDFVFTTNGPSAWQTGTRLSFRPSSLTFASRTRGFAGGDGLFLTSDAGDSWTQIATHGESGRVVAMEMRGTQLAAATTRGLLVLQDAGPTPPTRLSPPDPSFPLWHVEPITGTAQDVAITTDGRVVVAVRGTSGSLLVRGVNGSLASIPLPVQPISVATAGNRVFVLMDGGEVAEVVGGSLTRRFRSGARLLGIASRTTGSSATGLGAGPIAFGDFGTLLAFDDAGPGPILIVADAGPDQRVASNALVQLDGSGTTPGATLRWTQTTGPSVTLDGASTSRPSFVAPVGPATLVFELEARLQGSAAYDEVTITVDAPVAPPNEPPIAHAGPDRVGLTGARISLDGSGSFDPDGDALRYAWRQLSGPSAPVEQPDAVTTTVLLPVLDAQTTLSFELTVCDEHDACDTDTVTVTVEPTSSDFPTLTARIAFPADGHVPERTEFRLELQWSCTGSPCVHPPSVAQTSGPTLLRIDDDGSRWETPRVVRQEPFGLRAELCDDAGRCIAWLVQGTVLDNLNEAPVAEVGPYQVARPKQRVRLDGSKSSDPNGDPLTFQWTQISGPSRVTLDAANVSQPHFDVPVLATDTDADAPDFFEFELEVCDDRGGCDIAVARVEVEEAPQENRPPVADGGGDRTGYVGDELVLDGEGSYDPDGDPLVFRWSLPDDAPATLMDADTLRPRLVLEAASELPFPLSLEVCDPLGACDIDTIAVRSLPVSENGIDEDDLPGDLAGGCSCSGGGDVGAALALLIPFALLRRRNR